MPICGTLHHFGWHSGDPITSGDEEDWNNFLVPSAAFRAVFQDALPVDKSLVWKCDGEYCMEAEITPSSKFYENQWWSKKKKKAELAGQQICVYGPFVEEEWHRKRPEIHPSELLWWRDSKSESYWMLLQEDSSGRFDKKRNYANRKLAPPTWRPWAQAPRRAEFRLAFMLQKTHQQAETYFVSDHNSYNVMPLVPPDLIKHTLRYGGSTIEVTTEPATNKHVKVAFSDLCLTEDDHLQGYVLLTASVGLEKSSESGGQELIEISTKQIPTATPIIHQSQVSLVATTPSLVDLNGQHEEVGRLASRLSPAEKLRSNGISKINVIGTDEHLQSHSAPESTPNEHQIFASIDAIKGAALEIELQSGEKQQIELPPLGLALSVQAQTTTGPSIRGTNAVKAAFVRAIGGDVPVDLPLVQHRDVQLVLAIRYAPQEAGEVRPEDKSPFSEKLNRVLVMKDPAQLKKTLGSAYPFKAEWKFEAWELFADGEFKEFPVVPNGPVTDNQIGTHWHSRTMTPTLVIEFPPGLGRLFKVMAIGTYTDPSGASGKITDEIWNHEVVSPVTQVDRLLEAVAGVVGLTEEQRKLLVGSKSTQADALDYLADPAMRRANLLRLQAKRASQTGFVSMEDLRDLVTRAKSLSASANQ